MLQCEKPVAYHSLKDMEFTWVGRKRELKALSQLLQCCKVQFSAFLVTLCIVTDHVAFFPSLTCVSHRSATVALTQPYYGCMIFPVILKPMYMLHPYIQVVSRSVVCLHPCSLLYSRSPVADSPVSSVQVFAVDIEAHSVFSYQSMPCLLQVAVGGRCFVVDLLALHDYMWILKAPFEDANILKLFHGCLGDLQWLQQLDIYTVNVLDTCALAEVRYTSIIVTTRAFSFLGS